MNEPFKTSIKQFEAHRYSPYIPKHIERVRRTVKGAVQEVYTTEGELKLLQSADRTETAWRDSHAYVKVFTDEVPEMGQLGVPGLRLLIYLFRHIKPGKDTVDIDVDAFLDMYGYAGSENGKQRNRTHYYKGVVDLLNRDFLSKKLGRETEFFININRFFNGNRVELIKELVDE